MTDSKNSDSEVVKYNGEGHEIIGEIRVLKIVHDEGADRPFHLELNVAEFFPLSNIEFEDKEAVP